MEQVVIIGVGEVVEQVPSDLSQVSSPMDLMEKAAHNALVDAIGDQGDESAAGALIEALDAIALVRTFSDSGGALKSPYGDPDSPPLALASRIGLHPKEAVYSSVGGQSPQQLVNEFSGKIASGAVSGVLIAGSEALANQKALRRAKAEADWSEPLKDDFGITVQDRRGKAGETLDYEQLANALTAIPGMYTLFDHARRAKLGLSRVEYALECGKLFASFSDVAKAHPSAMFPQSFTAEEIAQPSAKNPPITDLFTRAMVAKDGVNLGGAIIMLSEREALRLGIDQSRFVYPVSGATIGDHTIPYREDLSTSVAMSAAYDAAFAAAGVTMDDIACMDIYSCFPIAVFSACEALGIEPDDPRGLTLTGGLPFFGGPGNNYSAHGIAALVRQMRAMEEGYGLIGANGGFLSKHSAGIYARKAPSQGWREADPVALKAQVDQQASPEIASFADGEAVIETFCVDYTREGPKKANIIGRLGDGRRFIAVTERGDDETIEEMLSREPIGRRVYVTSKGPGNRFTFDAGRTKALIPAAPTSLDGPFEHCLVERQGHVLEVTINRPEARNCLTPDANFELERVFDLFEAERELWVAILTGAGDKAFSAGNDLKYTASGKPSWVPQSGFGGLTAREGRTKPVIAAVNGFAYGGGCEIAMSCDIIVADQTAKFALPEVKSGLVAAASGVFRLPNAVPHHIAREMILTGRAMEAEEAAHYGLVNHVTKAGAALDKARAIAEDICAVSPTAVAGSLDMMNRGAGAADVVTATRISAPAMLGVVASEDMRIGLKAFVTKQKPRWKNQ
jgi:acetyl-CoA C-acetyltransferase